jgi:hypothetical protein
VRLPEQQPRRVVVVGIVYLIVVTLTSIGLVMPVGAPMEALTSGNAETVAVSTGA